MTSVVSAQDPTPTTPGWGYGRGGRGGMMGGGFGLMHDYMAPILTEAELEERYAQGETFWSIAEDQGLTVEEAQQNMPDARSAALDQMVADGVITQEQADWMKSRISQGGCMGGSRGGRGGGIMRGWFQDSKGAI